jgi:hypothetical protein
MPALSFEQRKFERGRGFLQKAIDEFAVNPKAIAFDRVSARAMHWLKLSARLRNVSRLSGI